MDTVFVKASGAQKILGLSRSKLLELTYKHEIPSVKVGKTRLFPVAGLHEWADRLVLEQTGPEVAKGE